MRRRRPAGNCGRRRRVDEDRGSRPDQIELPNVLDVPTASRALTQ
jgi:hypothetical protein